MELFGDQRLYGSGEGDLRGGDVYGVHERCAVCGEEPGAAGVPSI